MCSLANKNIPLAHADVGINTLKLLLKENDKESKVISPISLVIALSMAYAGAKEQTLKEMHKLLVNEGSDQDLHETLNWFLEEMKKSENENVQLLAANRVYVKEGFQLLDSFKETITKYYYGEFKDINFEENVKAAATINAFVEENTNNLIKDLISSGMIGKQTRLVLINALYFKGTWEKEFKKEATQKKTFYGCHGANKKIKMMNKKGRHLYYEDEFYQFLMIPYKQQDTFMYIVLPKVKSNLLNQINDFSGTMYMSFADLATEQEVDVYLPQFKLETSWNCNDTLKKLGMPTAFSDQADFRGITREDPLYISDVIQQACIEVNEKGTEAAAATAVIMARKCCIMRFEKPIEFNADHPFMYFIVRPYQRILFAGVYQ
uniref:SERPIN domain-containing protein n=1 Tax=Rhabditophanes sp. KR3021 TaxID=114890 RepID=A0AC35TI98_9BILA